MSVAAMCLASYVFGASLMAVVALAVMNAPQIDWEEVSDE